MNLWRLLKTMEMDKEAELELYRKALFISQVGNQAVNEVLEFNKKNNIPSVFSRNGIIYYLLPSGDITRESPFK